MLPSSIESGDLAAAEYETLAGFRFHVRRFFAFSEAAIQAASLSPMHYQAMLAIKAHPGQAAITITGLAERLFIRLNTAVELVGRMKLSGLIKRERAAADRRRIELTLTGHGAALLDPLARLHLG